MKNYVIELGDVVEVLKEYHDNSFDAVLCDPPYGISFMGRKWDYDVPQAELWREVLRVCKPGAALIAFSGTRTYHRTVVQIEDAGWEIRDQIAWMYGSGFPKSLDVSKAIDAAAGAVREVVGQGPFAARRPNGIGTSVAHGEYATTPGHAVTAPATEAARLWHGYGTALKPAYEPAVLARKPLDGTVAQNVERWGVGALAIDASRIGDELVTINRFSDGMKPFGEGAGHPYESSQSVGRWPANVILDEEAGAALDAQTGIEASRFFYCAKANRKERDFGCDELPLKSAAEMTDSEEGQARLDSPRTGAGRTGGARNHHPTVKPLALMQYLSKLIMPPKPGAILVPFSGSGSEMLGCLEAGWPAVLGVERESEYVEIAKARLKARCK